MCSHKDGMLEAKSVGEDGELGKGVGMATIRPNQCEDGGIKSSRNNEWICLVLFSS